MSNASGHSDASEHFGHLVDDYLHELLTESTARQLEAHCEVCESCGEQLRRARQRLAALRSLPPVEASTRLVKRSIEQVELRQRRRDQVWRWWSRGTLGATAAVILILGSLHAYFYWQRPSPWDIRVLGQESLLAGTRHAVRLGVFDRRTGEPVGDVPFTLSLWSPQTRQRLQLAELRTAADGTQVAEFQLPDWEPGRYQLDVSAAPGGRPEQVSRAVTLRREWKIMLTSDKPVYQPGQTIHLRSLVLRRPDLKPVAGQEVTFEIRDPQGNTIFRQAAPGSRFGISSADCPLGREIREGEYQVVANAGASASQLTVEVRKYVLPKFRVVAELDRPFYAPGDRAELTVRADYFFGQSVNAGKVQLFVVPGDAARLRTQDGRQRLEADLDTTGKASLPFDIPATLVGTPQESGAATLELIVQVEDTAGQTETTRVVTRVARQPIQLAVVPAAGTLVRGVENQVFLQATYPDGRPAEASIELSGGLSGELSGQAASLRTDSLGIAVFALTPDQSDVTLALTATDAQGQQGRRTVTLTAGLPQADFLLQTDRAVYDTGDTLQAIVRGGGVEPVFLDILREGQTVLSRTIPVRDGLGQLELDLPAELFGPLQLVAYRFGSEGLAVRKSRMVVVRRAEDLRLEVRLDADEYRPGQQARLQLQVTDRGGQPVPGAVSLAAVDEAVFSVLKRRPGQEQTFFQLESQLLQPIATVYGHSLLDLPDAPREQQLRLEQALLARTAHAAAGATVIPVRLAAGDAAARGRGNQFWQPGAERPTGGTSMSAPHTLAASSFPAKAARFHRERQQRLQGVSLAWCAAAGALALSLLAALAFFRPLVFVITMLVGLAASCFLVAPLWLLSRVESMALPGAAFSAEAPAAGELTMPGAESASLPRVREKFPETLLWMPQLITDDQGRAELNVELADSITTWRLTASAVSAQGQLGGATQPIRVFQPFFVDLNLPVALTRQDEVAVPVVVYNYLDRPQAVEVELKSADWFQLLPGSGDPADSDSPPSATDATDVTRAADATNTDNAGGSGDQDAAGWRRSVELGAGEVRVVHIRLRAETVGRHALEVAARAADVSDAVRREVEVVPNGRREETVFSGLLDGPLEIPWEVPEDVVPGSATAVVTLYPSRFAQLVEGLDAILRMPHGCFEQTSSTTYPNVLVLRYLRSTGQSAPEVEAKARQYIHVGYQRLLSFEVPGGGFDWFGNPPADIVLTAYGLLEFQDMARVHDVDPRLIHRTRTWLRGQRQEDGTWPIGPRWSAEMAASGDLALATTAYVAWALGSGGAHEADDQRTLQYLLSREPATIDSPYTLALLTNAVSVMAPEHPALAEYRRRLVEMAQADPSGKGLFWRLSERDGTLFFGSGLAGDIETTAMVVLALLDGRQAATVREAIDWLLRQQDSRGTWHSTQATILTLRALLDSEGQVDEGQPRQLRVTWDQEMVREWEVPADQLGVLQRLEFSNRAPGPHRLVLHDLSGTATGYRVVFRYHRDVPAEEKPDAPLAIAVDYDRQQLRVDDRVTATVGVTNNGPRVAPMVMLDLPIPPGFELQRQELDELVGSGTIARYEITPRQAIVYLRELQAGASLELRYRLRATMPVRVAVPDGQAYEYYDPQRRASGGATRLEVRET